MSEGRPGLVCPRNNRSREAEQVMSQASTKPQRTIHWRILRGLGQGLRALAFIVFYLSAPVIFIWLLVVSIIDVVTGSISVLDVVPLSSSQWSSALCWLALLASSSWFRWLCFKECFHLSIARASLGNISLIPRRKWHRQTRSPF